MRKLVPGRRANSPKVHSESWVRTRTQTGPWPQSFALPTPLTWHLVQFWYTNWVFHINKVKIWSLFRGWYL